jgi:membrane associated rhomboid family serine protease
MRGMSAEQNGDGENGGDGNIIRFPRPSRERKEPLLNLPPVTKALTILIVVIQVVMTFLPDARVEWIYNHFGFVPARYAGDLPFGWPGLVAPFTYAFLHGGWFHIFVNGSMLMAFGSGVERLTGGKRMFVFFMLCSLAALPLQWILTPHLQEPVVGASGGLSGLFAAVILMMRASGAGFQGRYGLWPFVILWLVITIGTGMAGSPDGSAVAWAAHIGGFLAGLALLKPVMRWRRSIH